MTNNEIANIDNLSSEQIMSMIGQEKSSTGSFLPKLSINRFPENDDGAEVPVGSYATYVPDCSPVFISSSLKLFINVLAIMRPLAS